MPGKNRNLPSQNNEIPRGLPRPPIHLDTESQIWSPTRSAWRPEHRIEHCYLGSNTKTGTWFSFSGEFPKLRTSLQHQRFPATFQLGPRWIRKRSHGKYPTKI